MTDKVYSIDEIKATVEPIAKQYGAERVYLFGSYARGEATAKSDLDFLIDKGNMRGLKFGGFQYDLSELFGKDVDLLSTSGVERTQHLKRELDRDKVMIYEFNQGYSHT